MSRFQYATRYECDCCGRVALAPMPDKMYDQPTPIGWTPYDGKGFYITFDTGRRLTQPDICPTCSMLPYHEVIHRLVKRHKET